MTIVTRSESAQFATKLTYDHEGNIVQRDTTARQAIIWSKAIKIGYQVSERNDRDRWEIVRNFACAKKGNGKNGSGKLIWKFLWRIEDNSMLSYEYFHFCRRNSTAFCQCCNASPSLPLTSNSSAPTFWIAIEVNSSAHREALLLWMRYLLL